jgi:hypothetical protein
MERRIKKRKELIKLNIRAHHDNPGLKKGLAGKGKGKNECCYEFKISFK